MQRPGQEHLALVRTLAHMRHEDSISSEGTMGWITAGEKDGLVAFVRTEGTRRVLVVANLSPACVRFDLASAELRAPQMLEAARRFAIPSAPKDVHLGSHQCAPLGSSETSSCDDESDS